MWNTCSWVLAFTFLNCEFLILRGVIEGWFRMKEPVLFPGRKRGRLRRRVFHCARVNDVWSLDQHDKWKVRFGVCLHACVDPFTGVLKWINVWWNNSNPVLISCYYLDVVERTGGASGLKFLPPMIFDNPSQQDRSWRKVILVTKMVTWLEHIHSWGIHMIQL